MKNQQYIVHVHITIAFFILLFGPGMAEEDIHVDGFFRWTHEDIATKDLLCPECCKKDHKDRCFSTFSDFSTEKTTICCVEKAMPYWKFDKFSYLRSYSGLNVRFDESTGKALLYDIFEIYGNYTFYDLYHEYASLSSFPDNLCQFPRLASIYFSHNMITNISDLGCLNILDTLDLSHNLLTVIKAFTFSNLPNLRYLYLSNNLITTLEPETFKYHPTSLKAIDISYNRLLSIDITNAIMGYFFFAVDYSHNFISNFTNLSKWKGFQEGDQIGGGWILLHYNNLTRIPDLRECGFRSMQSIFKVVFNYHIVLKNNPWNCDCFAYSYMNIFVQAKIHFSVIGIECTQPPFLKGYSVPEFRKNKQLLHQLTCKVSLKQKCPPKCSCYEQPSRDRVVVNCTLSGRSKMPTIVPDLDNLDIDLSKNGIQVFPNLDYLQRTMKIDLSHNKIHTIDPKVFTIQKLDIIHLYNNSLTSLDRSIQLKSPCKLQLGHVQLQECTCEMHWIKIWLEKQSLMKCMENVNIITCIKDEKTNINISDISEKELCPPIARKNTTYIWFVGATFLILVFLLLYFYFRYEILLILRNHKINLHRQNIDRKIIYDVYISFNVENNDVRQWTIKTLVSHLEHRGYNVCLPPRDFIVGGIHSEQIHEMITLAQSYLIILSEDYFKSQFQSIEWIHIWDAFKTDFNSHLIIINHDILRIKDLHDRKLRAFTRLGYSIDFSDFRNNLLIETEKRLKSKTSVGRYLNNTYSFKSDSL